MLKINEQMIWVEQHVHAAYVQKMYLTFFYEFRSKVLQSEEFV